MGDVVALKPTGASWVEVAAIAAGQIAAQLAAMPLAEVRGSVLTPIAIDLTMEALLVEGCPPGELERARSIVRHRVVEFFFNQPPGDRA